MAEEQKQRLGRGLAALIGDSDASSATPERVRGTRKVAIHNIIVNKNNPRKVFHNDTIKELAFSIELKGILQPLTVRATPYNNYEFELIAGERRWRAAQMAGLTEVPVHVIEATDKEVLELALIENLQREDLNAIDEANGYKNLAEQLGYSHQEIATIINKSRPHITNMIRLLTLPEEVQNMVANGQLSKSAARAVIHADDPVELANTLSKGTMRDTEDHIRQLNKVGDAIQKLTSRSKDPNITDVEQRLAAHLGLKVAIKAKGEGGELSLKYASLEQLEAILRLLEQR